MSIRRWDPFADMAQLREQVNNLFEQSILRFGQDPCAAQTWSPMVDIFESAEQIGIRLDVAGMNPADIDIQISGDTLTIKGERQLANDQRKYVRIERSYGPFQRSFTLGMPIDQDGIHASYRTGVLEILLPKREETRPRQVKIDVQTEDREQEIDAT